MRKQVAEILKKIDDLFDDTSVSKEIIKFEFEVIKNHTQDCINELDENVQKNKEE